MRTKDEPRDSLDPNEVESETPAQEALEENLDPALQTSVDLETPAQSVPESTTVHQIPNSTEENDLSAAEDIPESEPSSNDTYDTYSDGSKKDGSKEGASNIFFLTSLPENPYKLPTPIGCIHRRIGSGRIAQRESTAFTRQGSQVQILLRLPEKAACSYCMPPFLVL